MTAAGCVGDSPRPESDRDLCSGSFLFTNHEVTCGGGQLEGKLRRVPPCRRSQSRGGTRSLAEAVAEGQQPLAGQPREPLGAQAATRRPTLRSGATVGLYRQPEGVLSDKGQKQRP